MSVAYIEDPEAKKKSLMLKQKTFCNGQATGKQCKFYWAMTKLMDVPNPDHLRSGENLRYCLVDVGDATFLGDGGSDMAVYCNKYEPSKTEYDPDFEEYRPLTPEEIADLKPISSDVAEPTILGRVVAALKRGSK